MSYIKFKKWKKRFIAGITACMLAFSMTGCLDEDWSDDLDDASSQTQESNDLKNETGGGGDSTGNTDSGTGSSIFSENAVRTPKVGRRGNGEDTVTILVYMNCSNLESDDGSATEDLSEIVAAGNSDKVNIIVETLGTSSWSSKYGIESDHSQIYKIDGSGLTLVNDNLSQLDCTTSKTLSDFITWGVTNYPADRYILHFWDHGGGPVYGFGYDEFQSEDSSLTIDEIQTALKTSGVYFDFIGMDCCIMSSLEVCCALYDYCDYTILSEDFESGYGWEYTSWLKALYANTSISTPDLGKVIVDGMVQTNIDIDSSEPSILAVIDESMMKVLYTAWTDFAYANLDSLTDSNYSQKRSRSTGGRVHPLLLERGFFSDWISDDTPLMSDYYITDIMAVASNIDSTESKALSAALNDAIVYVQASAPDQDLTGLSVTLPYGDSDFYDSLQTIFTNCGFDSTYVAWLENFVGASGASDFYDYDDWEDEWNGWDDYEDDYDWSDWEYYDDDDYWDDDSWDWIDWLFDDSDYDGYYNDSDYCDDGYCDDDYYDDSDSFWDSLFEDDY